MGNRSYAKTSQEPSAKRAGDWLTLTAADLPQGRKKRSTRVCFVTLKCSCLLYSFEGTPQQRNPVAIAEWIHLFPSRTQSLSTHTSKVLGWRRPGRIESCWLMTHPKGCVFLFWNQGISGSTFNKGSSDIFWSMMFVSSTLMWWSSAYQRMLSRGLRT